MTTPVTINSTSNPLDHQTGVAVLSSDDPNPLPFPTLTGLAAVFMADRGITKFASTTRVMTWAQDPHMVGGFTMTQSTDPNRPNLLTDAASPGVAPLSYVRYATGTTLVAPAGAADFLHNSSTTVFLVWRTQVLPESVTFSPFYTSQASNQKGYELHFADIGGFSPRQLSQNVSNGAAYVINPNTGAYFNSCGALVWNVTEVTTSATRARIGYDGTDVNDISFSVTLPTGQSNTPLTMGNAAYDVAAMIVYSPALGDADREIARKAIAQWATLGQVSIVAKDAVTPRHYGYPGVIKNARGQLMAVYRNGATHAADVNAQIEIKRSVDGGVSWGAPAVIYKDVTAATDSSLDAQLAKLSNGDILLSWYFTDVSAVTVGIKVMRSTDDGDTWGTPITLTPSAATWTQWLFQSCPIVEQRGKLYWGVYGQNTGDLHNSAGVLISSDNGHTWPTFVLLGNGPVDVKDYQEPNILPLGGVNGTTLLTLIRDGNTPSMKERTSTDGGATWTAMAPGPPADNSPRMMQFADGVVVCLTRPPSLLAASLFRRIGAGSWTQNCQELEAGFNIMVSGGMLELTPGVATIVYGVQLSATQSEVHCRTWPEWQIKLLT